MTEKTAKLFAFPGTNAEGALAEKPRERIIKDFSVELADLLNKAIQQDGVPASEVVFLLEANKQSIVMDQLEMIYGEGDE